MKRLITAIFTVICIVTNCFSQDTINKKSGDTIQAKVLEVGLSEIKYKKFDNPEGPVFILLKSEVTNIHYENGTTDEFKEEQKTHIVITGSNPSNADLFAQGQYDAAKYYHGYKGASTATLVVGLLSPLAGLVPAIGGTVTPPKDRNLNYPNPDLMKKPEYNTGYKHRARKIKTGKIWSNWGIAFGVNLVLVILLTSSGN